MRLATFAIFAAIFLPGAIQAVTLEEILSKMDESASRFTSMSGNMTRVTYTKVIDDKSEESGTILLKKVKRELYALLDIKKPEPRTISLHGTKAELYLPGIKTVQEYNLGKKGQVEQFLLLGFGTTGKELAANYSVKFVGEENINGQKAYHLVLTPKSPQLKERLKQLELWMAESGNDMYPIQQKLIEPSGNSNTITYSDVKLNIPIPDDALRLKLPKGVKRETPQK
jgi:outer membrane lipoprotein-sorting protein